MKIRKILNAFNSLGKKAKEVDVDDGSRPNSAGGKPEPEFST